MTLPTKFPVLALVAGLALLATGCAKPAAKARETAAEPAPSRTNEAAKTRELEDKAAFPSAAAALDADAQRAMGDEMARRRGLR